MCHGPLFGKLLRFAVPLMLSSVLQLLFNAADVIVVGQFSGNQALAAVGSTSSLISLLVNLFIGLSVGANVMVARYYGAGDRDHLSQTTHTAILTALAGGTFLIFVGIALSRPVLELMGTPPDVIDQSILYMRIYFLGMPFIMLYNFGSAILRSIGDTRRPLLCLMLSGVINVILNLFFVVICGMSVDGVATATVISNIVSSSLIITFLIREKGYIKLEPRKLAINGRILKEIAGIGIPAGVQGVVFSFSNVCIQGALNGFGSVVMAGSSAALNFEYYTYYVINAFGQTCTTFVSQNTGANNIKRCGAVVLRAASMSFVLTAIVSALFIAFDTTVLSIFTTEPDVMQYGIMRMHIVLSFQVFNCLIEVFSGALRGMGHSALPAIMAIIGVCGFRLFYVFVIFNHFNTLEALFRVYPISWILTASAIVITFIIIFRKKYRESMTAVAA